MLLPRLLLWSGERGRDLEREREDLDESESDPEEEESESDPESESEPESDCELDDEDALGEPNKAHEFLATFEGKVSLPPPPLSWLCVRRRFSWFALRAFFLLSFE